MSEHLELPWTQYTRNGKLNIANAKGLNVANEVLMRDDAKFIVEAVNNYDRMKALIEAQQQEIERLKAEATRIPFVCRDGTDCGIEAWKLCLCPTICPRYRKE